MSNIIKNYIHFYSQQLEFEGHPKESNVSFANLGMFLEWFAMPS